MNDASLTELKVVVEQAVQPVRATMARKGRMREELLTHLVAIFDEEEKRLADERSALEAHVLPYEKAVHPYDSR